MSAAEPGLIVAWAVVAGTFFGPYGLIFTDLERLRRDVDRADRASPVQADPVALELRVFDTPQPEEIAWARGRRAQDEHLLALMVQARCLGNRRRFGAEARPSAFITENNLFSVRIAGKASPATGGHHHEPAGRRTGCEPDVM